MSKYHIVGNHMRRLNYPIFISFTHLSLPSRARCLCHSQVIFNTIILRATIAVNVHIKKDKRGHYNRF